MEGKATRGLVKAMLPLLMVALVMGQPPALQFHDDSLQFPPKIRGGPPFPGIGIPLIPGIPGIDPPKRKCAQFCAADCSLTSGRSRSVFQSCTKVCLVVRCGIQISDVVYDCTENCANSISPNSVSGREAQNFVISCYNNCNKN